MFSLLFVASLALVASTASALCPTDTRIQSSLQVGVAYNAEGLGNSAREFMAVPWGSPDRAGTCLTTIIPNGLGCAIPVATTGAGTYQFAVETRQVFNNLTVTEVLPFDNGTVLLSVEIMVGAREFVPLPVTFHGYVYMDYNDDCRIYSARAYADVPTSVLGMLVDLDVPAPGLKPVCGQLPIGGQKKRAAIGFQASL
ncbi:hypothetical protein CERZMDRAFT_101478 [Cercospora zeae-maydis SCOH1-5]|uniref:Ubiquitin 3 binding protein But2 C-terminal domain-containing protein n=1 Tax=Cercospora zeae-maydis SCOH1-5 TaxID=717836 RepID=A0A6A6F724_9PEZI|nr:hypothetical protein CERZMDRAFT_101478 [Cercospora zeae-maydis SCOH1-5]